MHDNMSQDMEIVIIVKILKILMVRKLIIIRFIL